MILSETCVRNAAALVSMMKDNEYLSMDIFYVFPFSLFTAIFLFNYNYLCFINLAFALFQLFCTCPTGSLS